ncbi:MAG: hypothetical protein Q9208_006216 [Pyrenodesmia sp. 3 TL-2023]
MKYCVAAVVAASLASIVAGQGCSTTANGPNAGNPIRAPLSQIVPAGTPFTITWDNTTPGSVAIELLRGPSSNVVPIRCLTEGITNTGEFVWTPSFDLEADVSRYGLRIIVTNGAQKGTFQYSNQFGISNDVVHPPTSSSSFSSIPATTQQTATTTSAVSQASDGQVEVPTTLPTPTQASTTSFIPIIANVTTTAAIVSTPIVSIPIVNSSVVIATTHIPIPVPVVPSGSVTPQTMVVLQPTNNMTVPASLQTSAPTRITASASASFVSSSATGTGSPIVGPSGTSAPISGAGKVLAGSILTALGALAAFLL